MKEILNRVRIQEEVISGINDLADIVKVTLGGKGKNVILNTGNGVQIINDGVSIAREVSFDHKPAKNTGASLAKRVAEKTNEEGGDGTTTSIVLLQEYVNSFSKVTSKDPRQFRDDIKVELDEVTRRLSDMSQKIDSDEDIERVAFVSSLDKEMSQKIVEVIRKTGTEGVISIESGKRPGVEYDVVEGVRVMEGMLFPQLMNHADRRVAEIENTPILLTRKSLNSIQETHALMQEVLKRGFASLAIVCEDISDDVAGLLIANMMQGIMTTIVVKTHDQDDLEVITGAKIITPENNRKFEFANIGLAKKFTASKQHTTVIGTAVNGSIQAKINELKSAEEHTEDEYDKTQIKRRIARLQGGVAIMRVAGETDEETKEKRLKLEDALNASKAALEEGIIPGGGLALYRIGEDMKNTDGTRSEAREIMIKVIQKPLKQILLNAEEDVDEIEKRIREQFKEIGYNVVTRKMENFFETGVIDPVKVTKLALSNAINMGNMIATADGGIVFTMEKPKD
jgi:chaperonin GroEL